MKSQQRRDEEAITIFTGLGLFAVIAVAGVILLVVADQLLALEGAVLDTLVYVVLVCAMAAAIGYIYRHRGD